MKAQDALEKLRNILSAFGGSGQADEMFVALAEAVAKAGQADVDRNLLETVKNIIGAELRDACGYADSPSYEHVFRAIRDLLFGATTEQQIWVVKYENGETKQFRVECVGHSYRFEDGAITMAGSLESALDEFAQTEPHAVEVSVFRRQQTVSWGKWQGAVWK